MKVKGLHSEVEKTNRRPQNMSALGQHHRLFEYTKNNNSFCVYNLLIDIFISPQGQPQ